MTRSPVAIPTESGALSGWLHFDAAVVQRDCAAVLCAPLGYEYTHSYRSLRRLADRLASQGIATVRFDYHGTGDSPGSDLDPGRVERWLADVRSAATFARGAAGREKILLVGVRLGAALAAEASGAAGADLLVLWNPVTSGRRYVREMQAVAATAARGHESPGGQIEAAGFVVARETAERLKSIDLMKSTPHAPLGVLVVERDDLESDPAYSAHLRARGLSVERAVMPGYAEMMAEPQFTVVPEAAIAKIAEWAQTRSGQTIPTEEPKARVPNEGSERPCLFGDSGDLFGILSLPSAAAAPAGPAVILLNSGSVHHVGPNRLYVTLARELARSGVATLRIDLHGLGDSPCLPGAPDNHPYPTGALDDAGQAVRFLREEFGFERFVLMGLCSGAHAAFHGALELGDTGIEEAVLINPLTFHWEEGMSLDTTSTHFQEVAYYGMAARDPRKWLKLLKGRVNVFRAALVLGRRLAGLARELVGYFKSTPLSRALDAIFKRGRRLSLYVSRQDPGFDLLVAGARRATKKALKAKRIHLRFIENADHTFTSSDARDALVRAVAEHALRLAAHPSRPAPRTR